MAIDFQKLARKQQQIERAKKSDRFQNILHFMQVKGYLLGTHKTKVIRNRKIDIKDILWAAKYEPRILEVFPAAAVHFPKKFKNIEKAPTLLRQIIEQIRRNDEKGDDYKWLKYQDMKKWSNIELKDARTRPAPKKKILRSFFLKPELDEKLQKIAKSRGTTKTEILEIALKQL